MSDETMKCLNCGSIIPANAKFCPSCGQSTAARSYCPHCGSPVAPNATFCDTCKQSTRIDAWSQATPNKPKDNPNLSSATHNSATDPNRPIPPRSTGPTFSSTSRSSYTSQTEQGNRCATISLVCGIISVVLPLVLSGLAFSNIAGLILGIVAVYQANQARDNGVEGGMQTAGFVLGIIGICIGGISIFACIACAGAIGAGYGALSSLLQSGGYYY